MKTQTFSLLLIISFILALTLCFFGFSIYKTWYKNGLSYDDIELYESLAFTEYEGGEGAKAFFPSPDTIKSFPKTFRYVDNRVKNNFFHQYCSFFMLDVYYDEENYAIQKASFEPIDLEDCFMDFTYLYQEVDNDKIKLIFCNDEEKIIRYLYLYGDILEAGDDPNAILMWNASGCAWIQEKLKTEEPRRQLA